MRILLVGLSITILSLFSISAPSAAPTETDVTTSSPVLDQADESGDLSCSREDVQEPAPDVLDGDDLSDEEVIEMACYPNGFRCVWNSQCCSGLCKTYGSLHFCS